MIRSPTRTLAATCLALLLAGCIASEGPASTLSAADGSGAFVIYLVLEEGQLTRAEAWWASAAPALDVQVTRSHGAEAIVLKNDVAVDRTPLVGTPERAVLLWNSDTADVTASAGDQFEVIVLNGTNEATMATFALSIAP